MVVLTIADRVNPYAERVVNALRQAGLRVALNTRGDKIGAKIRDAQLQKIPYMLVVGDREQQNGQVAVRHRKHGDLGAKPLDQFVEEVSKLVETKSVE